MENGDRNGEQTVSPGGAAAVLPIEFRGKASEYFGIWIVNLVLTIITIGIWSAWAKVRRKRYLLGSTYIDGHAFDYHAKGKQLLVGRLLVVAVLVGQNLLQETSIAAGAVATLVIFLLLPWVINRSLSFNARMTSWRNVRFNFRGDYLRTMGALLLLPFVGIVTLGLLWPLASRVGAVYIARRHSFGTAPFDADPRLRTYYFAGMQTVLVGAVVLVLLYPVSKVAVSALAPDAVDNLAIILPVIFVLAGAVAVEFYGGLSRKIIVDAISLQGGHRFDASISGTEWAWIRVSNLLLQAVTVFLLRPWAVVREWRYNCDHIRALSAGDLGNFIDSARPAGGAFGSEYADIAGFDFGL